jgi:hypothetical protein
MGTRLEPPPLPEAFWANAGVAMKSAASDMNKYCSLRMVVLQLP